MMELDHIAIAGETLSAAVSYVQETLGVAMQPGGEHAVFHTHNKLLGLHDGLYLEAIAVNPAAPAPDRARWFDLDRFSGPARLTNWICRCDDLDAALEVLPDGFGAPVQLQRGDLRWRMAVPQSGVLPFDNCAPALIEWQGDAHPAPRLGAGGCRLERLEVQHPDALVLAEMLAPLLQDDRVSFVQGDPGLKAGLDVAGTKAVLG
ncbi:Glyoxalase-like domain-containing protein [Sulfitobacter marinus]|uniref:Glyoxalase-like domain-containing protein n=1 Tax=Sulfitobacter marinus TaxID=394264 RepID=A0A1I6PH07_9RHOB|nr:VOC family protein [Sulfitobacter marinus]SFS39460.1 Glyoxalase-like domain-containing protein [Sulfitobacter marinus]